MNRKDESRQEHTHSSHFFKRVLFILGIVSISMLTWKVVYAVQPDIAASSIFAQDNSSSKPEIVLSAASGATIPFTAGKDPSTNEQPTGLQSIPHLVLFRNGELTPPVERTLSVTINSLAVPTSGITVTLRLETQHGDPDQGGGDRSRITVWQGSQRVEGNQAAPQAGAEASFADAAFQIEFGETSLNDQGDIPTPTDYYRLHIKVLEAGPKLLFSTSQEYAFLLESQWVIPLNGTRNSESSGPREMVVYFCDMAPYQRDARDPSSRLLRNAVAGYIQHELLPQMVDAIHLQTEVWGFSWDGWTSFGDSANRQRLEVALSDGETWYHAPAPDRGNSAIAINVNGGDNAEYETLTDGLMSTFHHELFHNLQRAIAFTSSGNGDVDGVDAAWQFFAEGMASFVPSVAQSQAQFSQTDEPRAYLAKAVKFVGGRGFPGELNASLAEVNPYHGAMYWRFLYEQCGGMANGIENPAAGMGVIRHVLQVLYSREIVDINTSTDLVQSMPLVIDRVLTSPAAAGCPFQSYTDSLTSFAQAIHALRLEGGRCTAPGVPQGCSFYDPSSLYSAPQASTIRYAGGELTYSAADQSFPAGIRSSFGTDFIDLQLRPEVNGQPLRIELHAQDQGKAQFLVQILKIQKVVSGGFSSPQLVQVSPAELLSQGNQNMPLSLSIEAIDLEQYNQLGVIITRVDANEANDSAGTYTLIVEPGS